jgi:hypothetical protein
MMGNAGLVPKAANGAAVERHQRPLLIRPML